MLRIDRCALICDLAEVYHIYDYRSLPASRVATFAVGLRNDSRIKTKMRGDDMKGNHISELILAGISDLIATFLFGPETTPSLVDYLMGKSTPSREPVERKQVGEYMVFESPEAFEAAWNATAMEA